MSFIRVVVFFVCIDNNVYPSSSGELLLTIIIVINMSLFYDIQWYGYTEYFLNHLIVYVFYISSKNNLSSKKLASPE